MNERTRIQIYDGRWDRVFQLMFGLAAVATAVGNFVGWWQLSVARNLTMITGLLGLLLVAFVIQSGRNGRLARMNYEAVNELCSSTKARAVTGHAEVHQAERTVLADVGEEVRVLSYVGPRGEARITRYWGEFWDTLGKQTHQNASLHTCVVFSVDDDTNLSCIYKAVQPLADRVDVSISLATPRLSCVIGDNSALLAFPLGGSDRGLAVVIEDPIVVKQLRIWFDHHIRRSAIPLTTFSAAARREGHAANRAAV